MYQEIREIPDKAEKIFYSTKNIDLPNNIPYIGMGSSYYAILALYFQSIPIQPFDASEYFHYLSGKQVKDLGVLISQSGRTSEVLWCRELFKRFYAITNELKSPLCVSTKLERVIPLLADKEEHSSSKTYVNTLITLYNGFGIDPWPAVKILQQNMARYEKWGRETAEQIYDMIYNDVYKGAYIIGNGPNIGTVRQSALYLSETTKYPFIGMSAPQYDHGPKETAKGSVVIVINAEGEDTKRTKKLFGIVENAGAKIFNYSEEDVSEKLSPITSIIPLNFLGYHLAKLLNISSTFMVGKKVTEVD
jgi:glucosamine--fructose-6-phosphate aminotransferase (isomerizing)